jgi:peptidoglycan/xylan/chitin deacetylase (PgdA/CDA1 family)
MAITVDDLPVAIFGDYRNDRHRMGVVQAWRDLIRQRRLPVTGFLIGENHRKQPALLEVWRSAGVALGNHTWSHPRLQKVGIAAYLRDLSRGHLEVAKHVPPGTRIPFRYPYLYEGFERGEREAIRQKLRELESPVAPVTVDTRDYYYARRYTAALREGRRERVEALRRVWRWDLEESTLRAEWLSRELFGREPPQILLLHANELAAHHLGEHLDWLEGRGYRFVTLAEALEDPAYGETDRSLSPTGDSLWLRLRRSRQLTSPM